MPLREPPPSSPVDRLGDPEFDRWAGEYEGVLKANLGAFGTAVGYYADHKALTLKDLLPTSPTCLLEFGCGIGRNLGPLARAFPTTRLWACDISAESLTYARRDHPNVHFFDARQPPDWEPADRPGLILLAGVLHHIPPAERPPILRRLLQWAAPGGRIVIFEHNPANPLTRRAVDTCPWDADAVLLRKRETVALLSANGWQAARSRYVLFFPPPLRFFRRLERGLAWCPLGAQHLTWAMAPPSGVTDIK